MNKRGVTNAMETPVAQPIDRRYDYMKSTDISLRNGSYSYPFEPLSLYTL